jgi:integrase
VKNGEDRLVVLNRVAKSVVEGVRGMHPTHVFCYRDHPVRKINNSAWKRLRGTVGLKHVRVHDLKHTFGRRLRAAGVPLETRKVLLGHRNGDITSHYSAPELAELLEAANQSLRRKVRQNSGTRGAETKNGYRELDNRLNVLSDLARPEGFEPPTP